VTAEDLHGSAHLSVRDAAVHPGVSKSFVARWRLSQRVGYLGAIPPPIFQPASTLFVRSQNHHLAGHRRHAECSIVNR
jgi:hypothetical protein